MYSKILLFYVLYIVHLTTVSTVYKTESKLKSDRYDPFHLKTEDYDLICRLQPNGYQCDGQNTNSKFYYNTIMKTCMTFEYGDCDFGLNQFNKLTECNEVCMGGMIQDSKVLQNLTTDVICRLQPDSGTCLEYIPMYYYDISTRSCNGFAYKGCGGNDNRFLNELECKAICNEAVPMPQKVIYV